MTPKIPYHQEHHYIARLGWLRAAVLGANDGIISTTSLLVGIAASGASIQVMMITGVAGWIAGAISMAAGEYVSVRSQVDIEQADLAMEARELLRNPEFELHELTQIYIKRGLSPDLAAQVAQQLTAHNALEAHARDEIGINEQTAAQPLVAALASAAAFSCGALVAVGAVWILPSDQMKIGLMIVGVVALATLGALSGYLSGTSISKGAARITLWGVISMLMTAWIGSFFHVAV